MASFATKLTPHHKQSVCHVVSGPGSWAASLAAICEFAVFREALSGFRQIAPCPRLFMWGPRPKHNGVEKIKFQRRMGKFWNLALV
jgi:hypothetical protein